MAEQEQQSQQPKQEQKKNYNTGLISLEIVAKFNQIDIDMRSIVRNYGIESADISPEEIIRIAQNEGFKVKKKAIALKDMEKKYPLPAIVRLKDDVYNVVLAIKHDENKAMILDPREQSPKAVNLDEFQKVDMVQIAMIIVK